MPPYIRGVARGINPADPEAAINEAVAAIKKWSVESKNPAVKAAALAALAQWEAAKRGDLSNSSKVDIALAAEICSEQDGPRMTGKAKFGGKKAKPFGKKREVIRAAAKGKLQANKAAEKRESLNFTRQDAKDLLLSWDSFDAARGTKPKTAATPPPATGNAAGYAGPAQSQAVIDKIKSFQKAQGIPVTGNLDAATYNAAKDNPNQVAAAAAAKKGASAAKSAAAKQAAADKKAATAAKTAANKSAAATKKAATAAASQAKKDAAVKAKKDAQIQAAKDTIAAAGRTPAQNAAAKRAASLAAAHALLAANGG